MRVVLVGRSVRRAGGLEQIVGLRQNEEIARPGTIEARAGGRPDLVVLDGAAPQFVASIDTCDMFFGAPSIRGCVLNRGEVESPRMNQIEPAI